MTGARISARSWGWTHVTRSEPAVRGVTLDIAPGERVLLLGASGAGKSTLLHGMAGVLGGEEDGHDEGTLSIDGRLPLDARGEIGLVLQDPDSQVVMARVGDDVAFACENLGVPREEIWPRVRWALEAVGLDVPLDHPTSHLSGGQTQRLALAGILAMHPRVLLLDEPTANLDPAGVERVRDVVADVARSTGITVVIVEHRVDVWQDVATRAIVLGEGGVVSDGTVGHVLRDGGGGLAASGIWLPGERIEPECAREDTAGATAMLATRDIVVGRPEFGRRVTRGVASFPDTTLASGRAWAVTGPNGAGKSTFALTLAGLLAPAAGEVVAQHPLARGLGSDPFRWRSRRLAERIGMVFQQPEHQFLTATVDREMWVGASAAVRACADEERWRRHLLERLRLDHLRRVHPLTLSGGEKRRLSVAVVLAGRPDVLVLDEPTFGQDSVTWRELVGLLIQMRNEGTCIVCVTHDPLLVDALADRVVSVGIGEGAVA